MNQETYQKYFSESANRMKRSEIRELLKLTRQPGVISFAGGLPAPEIFPVKDLSECFESVLETQGRNALNYGPTEGEPAFREALCKTYSDCGVTVTTDNILVITSSQQGLDLCAKIFVNPGDIVITEKPTYVGAIQAFRVAGADFRCVDLLDDGPDLEGIEAIANQAKAEGKKISFIYVVPDFQNPAGITMSLEKRKKLLEIAEKHDLLIVEDSPYQELRFQGDPISPMFSMNQERVIELRTFSKILAPGFRLGWIAAPVPILDKFIMAKQSADLCSPPVLQSVLCEYMKSGKFDSHIKLCRKVYKSRKDKMLETMDKHMPKVDGLSWTRPEGGVFLWLTLPEGVNTIEMFKKSIEKKVAYVVGVAFCPDGSGQNALRLNYSFPSEEDIEKGIISLSEVIKESLKTI